MDKQSNSQPWDDDTVPRIQLSCDPDNVEQSSLAIVEAMDSTFADDRNNVSFSRFTEGKTNILAKVTKKDAEGNESAVLVRAYGQDTEILIDREREIKTHALLASKGLASPLLARFENGIVYRFCPGDVCTISSLEPDVDLLSNGNDSEPQQWMKPSLWSVITQWIGLTPDEVLTQSRSREYLRAEFAWIVERLVGKPDAPGRDLVFAHCDPLLGTSSVLRRPDHSPMKTLGGYAVPAPAAFELANHFGEWAGFECDYSKLPTQAQRRDFLKYYVRSRNHDEYGVHSSDADQPDEVELLHKQVDLFRGVPGFRWGIWALIQQHIATGDEDFDFADYAEKKFGEYEAWKAELDGSRQERGDERCFSEKRWADEGSIPLL
ncbi:Putative protein kinase-like domain superfamily [Septoria linicola]|uniref:ethanolamine kinase n=1 Tax=Septoria linicola TaxID=215465 RepID=A0A9Q9AK40_9PEZI|nr:Putative protein kinase-like domain superfamily [Septoria linicola]